jgi:hypothetical protein
MVKCWLVQRAPRAHRTCRLPALARGSGLAPSSQHTRPSRAGRRPSGRKPRAGSPGPTARTARPALRSRKTNRKPTAVRDRRPSRRRLVARYARIAAARPAETFPLSRRVRWCIFPASPGSVRGTFVWSDFWRASLVAGHAVGPTGYLSSQWADFRAVLPAASHFPRASFAVRRARAAGCLRTGEPITPSATSGSRPRSTISTHSKRGCSPNTRTPPSVQAGLAHGSAE